MEINELKETFAKLPKRINDAYMTEVEDGRDYRFKDREKSVVFSEIKSRLARKAFDKKLSEVKLERLALTDPEWKEYIEELTTAEHKYLVAKATVKALEVELKCMEQLNYINTAEHKV